ncbi:PREDICTED: uncharacterized protein LOC108759962 [Trachymyrmex cornetzi]|uniref:uncharacterized protein LOC108759962 n=1 Tax=Trachymyrmex cornetzi TaxID=471704 RepID=UPI00084F54F3|nr:PREDICTED: uncharacterized protein LOC108759962 [Trachymyrmex cornetzi]
MWHVEVSYFIINRLFKFASSKTTSGISLNDALMVGPVLQQEGLSILIRFRTYDYVLTGDLEKMILWREDSSDNIETYELLTLTYGTPSASFVATKVIQQLAKLQVYSFPKGSLIACRDFYVDDLITGANSKEEQALDAKSESKDQLLELDKEGSAKTLGINWNPSKDLFQYRILSETSHKAQYAYKEINLITNISNIRSTGTARPDHHNCETHDSAIVEDAIKLKRKLQMLKELNIPRKIVTSGQDIHREIHGFCDASERAYGACIYMRSINAEGTIEVHLICSKSRVAPVKALSIPRLELCRAQLLAQLMDKVDRRHSGNNVDRELEACREQNPADLVSRGISAKELVNSQLWWGGSRWLHDGNLPEDQYEAIEYDESQLEERDRSKVALASDLETNPFNKFSTFNRLVRVAATCLRFIHNCRDKQCGLLTVEELQEATRRLIKKDQELTFDRDIKDLKDKRIISSRSNLKPLNPFIDKENIIRVGGRLQRSYLHSDVKHPCLLHQRSHFTRLIIEHEHQRLMHAGIEATLAAIRLKH